MTIKEVSKKYGISTDALRYYERIGLFPHIKRTESGIRNFDEEACEWIAFIKCMRDCGVQIASLTQYVALSFVEGTELEQRTRLHTQRDELDATIERLNKKMQHYEDVLNAQR